MKGVGSRWVFGGIALAFGIGACDEATPTGPTVGTVRVTATTSGPNPDTDGYTVSLDGGTGLALASTGGEVFFTNIAPGTGSVELTDVAGNCTVDGANPASATVTAGDTTTVAFDVTCTALASDLVVTTATTGDSLDADGYVVIVGADSAAIDINGTHTFADVAPGDIDVTLDGVAPNCTVTGGATQTVTVPVGANGTADFEIVCVGPAPAPGTVIVSTATSGDSLDADGYTVTLGALSDSIGINDTITFDSVPAGTSFAVLSGIAPNCTAAAGDSISVTLAGGDTVTAAFAVTCTAPTPVGPQEMIAFTTDRDGNDEVYLLDPDSTGGMNLTNDAGADGQAAWSPDSTRIAFTTDRDGNSEIYLIDADGGNLTNLTNDAGSDSRPAWSGDGTQIAFVTDRDGNSEVYVMNADGSSPTNLTNDAGADTEPAWSADGTKIAFATDRDGNSEVYSMDPDGSNPTNLTNDAGADSAPDWSADGTQIAFVTDRDGNSEVYAMNADGSSPANLTNDAGADGAPSWSPDGTRIAFVTDRDGNNEIYLMAADGSGAANLSNDAGSDRDPDWGVKR